MAILLDSVDLDRFNYVAPDSKTVTQLYLNGENETN